MEMKANVKNIATPKENNTKKKKYVVSFDKIKELEEKLAKVNIPKSTYIKEIFYRLFKGLSYGCLIAIPVLIIYSFFLYGILEALAYSCLIILLGDIGFNIMHEASELSRAKRSELVKLVEKKELKETIRLYKMLLNDKVKEYRARKVEDKMSEQDLDNNSRLTTYAAHTSRVDNKSMPSLDIGLTKKSDEISKKKEDLVSLRELVKKYERIQNNGDLDNSFDDSKYNKSNSIR